MLELRDLLAMTRITHDLSIVAAVCDELAVMYRGRIAGIVDNPIALSGSDIELTLGRLMTGAAA